MSNSLWSHGLYSPWDPPGQNTRVGSLSLLQGLFLTQESNPGLPHCRWILYQLSHLESPRILEWVVYPFSKGSSRPRNRTGVSCIAGGFFTNWAIGSVQSLSCVWLFATPWTAAHQASLCITNSRSLLNFMPTESVMPSNHLILCLPFSSRLQSFPASGFFQMNQLFASGGSSHQLLEFQLQHQSFQWTFRIDFL